MNRCMASVTSCEGMDVIEKPSCSLNCCFNDSELVG